MSNPVFEDAVAIVPVSNIEQTARFYEDVLGFQVHFMSSDKVFAIIKRERAVIHFLKADDASALQATASNISIYIWINGLERLYRRLEPKLSKLPEGRVRAPLDQDYGVREFHVKDPDGCLLFFAEDNSGEQH